MDFVKVRFYKSTKIISFFGSMHSKEKEQIENIKSEIDDIDPDLVMVEDGYYACKYSNEEEAIEKGRELGFAAYYAKERNIPVVSNDPSDVEDVKYIVDKFGKNLAFLYFVLRFVNQTLVWEKKINDEEINQSIDIFKSESNWDDFDYSIANFFEIYKEVLGKGFEYNLDHSDLFDPGKNICKLNEVSKVQDEFRDKFMIDKLKELLRKYNRIFIIKGNGHLDYFVKYVLNVI